MRRSARLTEMYANLENEAHEELNASKIRWDNKNTTIATMDNGTMIEIFKFLNYCQLAINSLVSKRFRDLIQTHRQSLAFLYVHTISMKSFSIGRLGIKIFDKKLSPEAYNEWVVRSNFSKEAQLEEQDAVASVQNTQNVQNRYHLVAYANYKDPYHRELRGEFTVLFARVERNHETWPLFEHFVRLLTDPFVFIRWMELTPQTDVFKLLATTIDRNNRGRLQCEILNFYFNDDAQNFFNWIKDYVRCVQFRLADSNRSANRDKQLLDFFASGSDCASEIVITISHLLKGVIVGLLQKFVDLKSCDESHIVHTIRGNVVKPTAEALKSNYAKFFMKEERDRYGWTARVFEIVNADIGKKMRLTVSASREVTLEIMNF